MKAALLWSLVAITLLSSAQSMFLPVTSKPLCMTIDADPGKEVRFFYSVTGNNEDNMQVTLRPTNGSQPAIELNGKEGKTKFSQTSMYVCFISTDGGYKSVSIDFYNHDVAHLADLASKSDIYELHAKLIDVGEKIKEVNKVEMFEEERQSIQGKTIEKHESKLKMLVGLKLAAIVAVAGAQLYLLKNMLDKNGRGYQPV